MQFTMLISHIKKYRILPRAATANKYNSMINNLVMKIALVIKIALIMKIAVSPNWQEALNREF